ncbi:hypothetical protein AALA46_11555 [Enterocloster aldenensis]|uniref:hypothetical protein n=1 Tax=Enterocloster aldenensis TaxID=358742 RepID=UPI002ED097BA
MKKALFYGILASFFFAFTFILNRSMNLAGGYWLWSACLRYLFTLPMMVLMLAREKGAAAEVLGKSDAGREAGFCGARSGSGCFTPRLPLAPCSVSPGWPLLPGS